ncbi:MAG: selenophosphate synthase [Eubacteriaceae bacterium]
MRIEKFRDLTLVHIDENIITVLACDSCGGIGLRELDVVKADYEVLGYFTTSVVLCELLAFRAKPTIIVNNICMEMEPSGRLVIDGIKKAAEEIQLNIENMLTGSTEENMPVKQSGIGITCMGIVDKRTWTIPKTNKNDSLYAIGKPKVGEEVLKDSMMSNLQVINYLKDKDGINEILPVGSKGISFEVNELCKCNNLSFKYLEKIDVDINKSAGPATCILVSGDNNLIEKYLGEKNITHSILGEFGV